MNSDPTGYFTLFEMSIAMNVQNTLRDTYNSAIIDGFLNFLDTLLAGETDPTALLTSFASGVNTGLVTGALSSGISAMANLSCKLAKASSMLKMGMAGFGFLGSAYSTLQSVEDGNAQQAGFRFILTALSGIGFKRAMGEGMATINSNCFIAGTLVLTENGNKPIEEIQAGDKVLAENPETGEQEYKEVVQVFENEANELVHLTVNGEEIVTTPKHPFYVPQRGWISAIDLKAGDILVLSNGEYVIVEQVQHEILETPVKIYNFEVHDFHTYYVGENSVLVHNLGCGDEVRVGRWMSQSEYDKMIETGRVQMSPSGNTTYVANPADINAFNKQAKPGSIYVEFDVNISSVFNAGKDGWGQIPGPGSILDRLNQKKGLPAITEMPIANNIKIGGKK